jgi:methyl-accepting chemotaxis protein
MRNQALLEYNQAIAKIPKAISDAADSFVTLGDRAMAAFGGASPSIKKFNDELAGLKITTDNWGEAITQANSLGQYASGVTNLSATVNTLASRFGISQQAAFDLAKQLSDLSKNPSPGPARPCPKITAMKSSSTDGQIQ